VPDITFLKTVFEQVVTDNIAKHGRDYYGLDYCDSGPDWSVSDDTLGYTLSIYVDETEIVHGRTCFNFTVWFTYPTNEDCMYTFLVAMTLSNSKRATFYYTEDIYTNKCGYPFSGHGPDAKTELAKINHAIMQMKAVGVSSLITAGS